MKNTLNHTLDKKVFEKEIDFVIFEEILETLDYIIVKKVPRSKFDSMNGKFLINTGTKDNLLDYYELFLPDDLQKGELFYFIYFLTTKFNIQKYSQLEELISKIKIVLGIIIKNKGEDSEEYLKGLTEKYHLSSEFIDKILSQKIKPSQVKDFIQSIKNTRLSDNNSKLGKYEYDIGISKEELSKLFLQQFETTFFRKGINTLRTGLMTFTQEEQIVLEEKIISELYELEILNDGSRKYNKGGNVIGFNFLEQDLEQKEKFLRDEIGIDLLHMNLLEARESLYQEKIDEAELFATNKIIKSLFKYPYQDNQENNGYIPSGIFKTKEIQCVGFSLLGHSFLSELGIKHFGLDLDSHSALEVIIGDKHYYFDATASSKVHEFKYGKQVGSYKEIESTYGNFPEKLLVISGDPEKILFSSICNNKGDNLSELGKFEEAILMYKKAIEYNPNFSSAYNNKGNALFKLGKFEEAILMYKKAIEYNPNFSLSFYNKGNILSELGKFEEAILMYEKAIEYNPNSSLSFYNKGNALFKLGKFEEAILMYEKVIEYNPNFFPAYNNKGFILGKIGKDKLSNIYFMTSKLLKGKISLLGLFYIKEKRVIKNFINLKDFEGLSRYLVELDKVEN